MSRVANDDGGDRMTVEIRFSEYPDGVSIQVPDGWVVHEQMDDPAHDRILVTLRRVTGEG